MPSLLELDKVTIRFGGLTAVSELNLNIGDSDMFGLIGPNGAGKTTAFNLITGVYQPTSGSIIFNGQCTVGLKPHQLARLGIARTFQNIRLFVSMTVFDNVRTAVQLHRSHGIRDSLWRGHGLPGRGGGANGKTVIARSPRAQHAPARPQHRDYFASPT